MQFPLRNTIKLSRKKKEKFKESQTVFFRFFLQSFDVVFHTFRWINQTFHQNKNKNDGIKLEVGEHFWLAFLEVIL